MVRTGFSVLVLGLVGFGVLLSTRSPQQQDRLTNDDQPGLAPRGLTLPGWVQATRRSTLWREADGAAGAADSIAPNTLLRVLDARSSRLRVSSPERVDLTGWVDIAAVRPSDAPGRWLTAREVSTPYRSADGSDAVQDPLDIGTYLRIAGTEIGSRIPVEIDPGDGPAPRAWVEISTVEVATRPDRLVATTPPPPLADMRSDRASSREEFLEKVTDAALASQRATRVPASVTVAQAILESNWGESGLAIHASNYFGIKAAGRIGPAGVIWMPTQEFVDGKSVTVNEPFRVYHSLLESIDDHAALFTDLRRYADAMTAAHRPIEFAEAIRRAGYSTDPAYVVKLSRLIQQYDLARLDAPSTAEVISSPD